MKKLIIAAVIIVFGLSANADASTNYAKRVGGYFYTSLSPYGTWIEIGFGTPVWRPTMMKRNWAPYAQGQWIYTNYGWYWDSYESFGDIVYHYGRWYYDDYYGWVWVPDYEWAPAWVEWRYDDDYIGWAPLSPYAVFSIHIGIHFTYDYYVPYNHWNYVHYNHFCDNNVYNYYVAPKYKYRVHNRTKMRTNYSYYNGRVRNDGVEFDRIRKSSGRNIEKRNIVTYSNPMERSKVRDNSNNREIRTYIASREDISQDGLRDVKIERKERKTSLDLSKVELGSDNNLDRTKDPRKDNYKEVIRNKFENSYTNLEKSDRTVEMKKEIDNRNSEITNRKNEQIKRNEEIKPNKQNKINEQVEIQRKTNVEMKKRDEVTVQKRQMKNSNTEVIRPNNERKVEQKKQIQKVEQKNQKVNTSRNTDVKKSDANSRTQSKEKTRTSDKDNKSKSR